MPASQHFAFPTIRTVGLERPWVWLGLGLQDMRANPLASLAYGAAFAAMGMLLSLVLHHAVEYIAALTMGFLLVGPLLSIGLYDLSRQRARGERPRLAPSLVAWRDNLGAIGVYVVMISVVFLLWARGSLVVFAVFYTQGLPTLADFLRQVLSFDNLPFLLWWFGEGLFFACVVFAISVVSIPYLVDTPVDAVTAAVASVVTLTRNRRPLALWAFLIVLLIGIGFATFYVLLVFTAPLIGHATWHVYCDLIDRSSLDVPGNPPPQ
jgi:uncharacterized membrane protein